MAGRPPEGWRSGMAQLIAGGWMSGVVSQLKGDVMNSRLGDMYKVDHVMIAVAGQKRRDAFEFVRVPKIEEVLVKPPQFVGLRVYHRDVPEAQGSHAAFLEPGRGRFDMGIELKHVTTDDLDFNQRRDAGLAVGFSLGTQAEITKVLHEVRDLDVRLELVSKAQQRLWLGFLEDDVVMFVSDREIGLPL